jgi:ATP-dependent DNA ligase
VLDPDGVSDFGALHSGRHNEWAQLYAFDILAADGEDQRQLPLSLRKINLVRLLKRRIPGVFIAEYEEGEIGRDLLRVACNMGVLPQNLIRQGSRRFS